MEDPGAGRDALPCAECPEQRLNEYLETAAGRVIYGILDLDFAIQAGIRVSLDQIPYPDFILLRQLADERTRYTLEANKPKRD